MNAITPHEKVEQLVAEHSGRRSNEAETRRNIIDTILREVLLWPDQRIRVENSNTQGFTDYLLLNRADEPILVVEAKKSGVYFELPRTVTKNCSRFHTVPLKKLMTHKPIKAAVNQAMTYAVSEGCRFGMITNGFEWVLFRTFIRAKKVTDADAVVIPHLSTFAENFLQIENLLQYTSIVEDGSLDTALPVHNVTNMPSSSPKDQIASYDTTIDTNYYAKYMAPIANKIMRDIPNDDDAFMSACYVVPSGQASIQKQLHDQIRDRLTPYFEMMDLKKSPMDQRKAAILH